MRIYKKFSIIALLCIVLIGLFGTELSAQELQALLMENDCEKALPVMSEMAEEQINGKLFYNLAICSAKQGNYEASILYAKKADEWQFNPRKTQELINIAEEELELQWNKPPEFFLFRWIRGLRELTTSKRWAFLSILFLIISAVAFYWSKHISIFPKIAGIKFYAFIALAVISLALGGLRYKEESQPSHAVMLEDDSSLLSAPEEGSNEIRTIPKGSTVRLRETLSGYQLIVLPNLEEGWVKPEVIGKI